MKKRLFQSLKSKKMIMNFIKKYSIAGHILPLERPEQANTAVKPLLYTLFGQLYRALEVLVCLRKSCGTKPISLRKAYEK